MKYSVNELKNIINEALSDNSFDFHSLDNLVNDELLDKCYEMFGNPIANGSVRYVFEVNDKQCLKVSYYDRSNYQNMEEIRKLKKYKNLSILPKLYDYSSNGNWMLCEMVLPARDIDFVKLLGVHFGPFIDETNNFYDEYDEDLDDFFGQYGSNDPKEVNRSKFNFVTVINQLQGSLYSSIPEQVMKRIISYAPKFYKDVSEYASNEEICDFQLNNMGIAMRNGKPQIVFLDTGL